MAVVGVQTAGVLALAPIFAKEYELMDPNSFLFSCRSIPSLNMSSDILAAWSCGVHLIAVNGIIIVPAQNVVGPAPIRGQNVQSLSRWTDKGAGVTLAHNPCVRHS